MKTRSCWGDPPSRLYRFIRTIKPEFPHSARVCVIGASDGKFVLPFLRNGFHVTAYEIDDIALFAKWFRKMCNDEKEMRAFLERGFRKLRKPE